MKRLRHEALPYGNMKRVYDALRIIEKKTAVIFSYP